MADVTGERDDPLWADLVSCALVGTARRAPAGPAAGTALARAVAALPDEGDAARLLDMAALVLVHRRAGRRPGTGAVPPPPCPPDDRPVVPPAAAASLREMLAATGPDRSGTADLLPEWLALAAARGHRAPEADLPALLDAARARTDLRADVAALAGPRGRWLARANPAWAWLTRAPGPVAEDAGAWAHGQPGERLAHLTALRARDPRAGRDLLAATWPRESAEDRALLAGALRTGLGPDDEAFLERALDDPARPVRATAAALLAVLPGSAYAARMAGRARACLFPDGPGAVGVRPPEAHDAGMRRDGIAAHSPTGRDPRAWWLGEIVAATDPRVWEEVFGEGPAAIVARRLPADRERDVREGWARAAVTHGDRAWARALAGRGAAPRLLGVLPVSERAARVARHVDRHGLSEAFQLLAGCPAPWPGELTAAVLRALAAAAASPAYPWSFSGVLGLAGRSADPAAVPEVAALAAAVPDGPWRRAFTGLADVLRRRAALRDGFEAGAEAGGVAGAEAGAPGAPPPGCARLADVPG